MNKLKRFILVLFFCFLVVSSTFQLFPDDQKPETLIQPDRDVALSRYNQIAEISHCYFNPFFQLPVVNIRGTAPELPNFLNLKYQKRFTRALLEYAGHFVYATSSYWIRQDVMKEDWEYHFTWKDQKKRIFELDGFRFDSNTFEFNWTHSLAGSMYYNYARDNHLNKTQSFLMTFGASFLWESLVEFKEVISLNDMVTTPIGGLSIGESFYQLGRFFRSGKPTIFNKAARFLSNPIMALNEFIGGKKYRGEYSLPDGQMWHDCRLTVGPRFDRVARTSSDSFIQVGFESQLMNIPEYGEPGAANLKLKDTLFTEIDGGLTLNKRGIYEFNLFAKSVLFGYFSQNIQSTDSSEALKGSNSSEDYFNRNSGEKEGYSMFIGAASAFDIVNNSIDRLSEESAANNNPAIPDRRDKYTIINLIGPSFDFSLFRKNFQLHFITDAFIDFGLIHSHAYKDYSELNEVSKTKCTLESYNYYYAFGVTLSSMLQLNYSNLELRGRLKYHYFNSIEGHDRYQSDIPAGNDFNLTDRRLLFKLSLGYRIPGTPLQLAVGLDQIKRRGQVEDFLRKSEERRSYIQLQYIF